MTKYAKKLCKPVAWAVALATIAQLGAVGASAEYDVHQDDSAAVTSTVVADDYYEESMQGQNKVTKYRNQEDGKIKTIFWTRGINPPIMGGKDSQFKRIEMTQGQEKYVDYISPYIPNHGWYDVNKTEDREDDQNLCFAAAASNSLHWWMDQNADYISRYAQTDISSGVKEKLNKYNHSFVSQSDSEIYRLFVGQFGKKKEGYWPDILQDQFINGYHPSPNGGTNDSDAARDKLLKGPHALGGVFFDIFKTNMLTQRCGYGNNYHDFSRDIRDFLLDDKLVLLTYATGSLSHVVTVWGAEFDANGEISGVYLTDSDDDTKDGMRRYNVVNSGGTPILTTRVGSTNGSKIVMLETLSLGKDLWAYGLKDEKRPLGIEWSDKEFEYDGNVHVPKAKLSNVSYGDQVTVEVTGGQSDAGEHTATAVITGADAERYKLPANASTTFTIAKAAADVTAEVDTKFYENNGTVTLTATVFGVSGNNAAMPNGSVRFIDCTNGAERTLGTVPLNNGTAVYAWTGMSAGNYEIAAVFEGDSNYKQTQSPSVFVSLSQRPQGELVMDPIGVKTYGDGPFALSTNDGSGSDVVVFQSDAPDVIEISGNMATIKKAGTAVITAKRVGAADQDANKASVTVQVAKKDLTLIADSHSGIVQGSAMPVFSYTVRGLVNGDIVTGAPTITAQVSDTNTAGQFVLEISGGTIQNQESYQIQYVNGTLTIDQKPEEPVKPPVFNDVFQDDFYYEAVQWAAQKGITKGINEYEFAPDRTCTRAETVAMLWRAAGRPEVSYDHGFIDVSPDAYYATAVSWAKKMGITAGVEENEFAPDQVCTRAEIVTLLWRYHGSPNVTPSTSFVDVESDSFYAKSVYWAEANRITVGTGDGEFSPNGANSRAEMVTFLYRARDIS